MQLACRNWYLITRLKMLTLFELEHQNHGSIALFPKMFSADHAEDQRHCYYFHWHNGNGFQIVPLPHLRICRFGILFDVSE